MNPRSFPNTKAAHSKEKPEAVNMSLDSPDSPEEVGQGGGDVVGPGRGCPD